MTNTMFFAAATVFASLAAPTIASPKANVQPPAAPAPAPAEDAEKRRYCFQTEQTGSRVPRKVCQTRAEWRAEGVDVAKYTAR